jgi:hypothetical protein
MRLLLTLLAVLAMLASPALAGTKVGCQLGANRGADCVSVMDMAVSANAAHPCCDPGSKSKSMHKGCGQMCEAPCDVAVTVTPLMFNGPSAFATLAMPMPNAASLRAFEPLGLRRPPKHLA